MITVHVVYDKAVFLTNEEYRHKTGKRANVQCQPEIYMLVLGSSSVEDQAAIIPDHIECLSDLVNPVVTQLSTSACMQLITKILYDIV